MIIENEEKILQLKICNIEPGECFVFNEYPYVKIKLGVLKNNSITHETSFALNLKTNTLEEFYNGTLVIPVNAKVVVE